MSGVNQAILLGNLTRDPQSKSFGNGKTVCEFGLAMNRKYRDADGNQREDVAFVDVSAFGRIGEVVQQYCSKGSLLYVWGRLRFDTWEDKQGGGKRSKLSVVAENITLLGGSPGNSYPPNSSEDSQQGQPPRRQSAGPSSPQGTAAQQRYDQRTRQNPRQPASPAPRATREPEPGYRLTEGAIGGGSDSGGYDPDEDLRDLGERF